jgi:hypothetical protein
MIRTNVPTDGARESEKAGITRDRKGALSAEQAITGEERLGASSGERIRVGCPLVAEV